MPSFHPWALDAMYENGGKARPCHVEANRPEVQIDLGAWFAFLFMILVIWLSVTVLGQISIFLPIGVTVLFGMMYMECRRTYSN